MYTKHPINRTKVELKYLLRSENLSHWDLSIVPEWNWNSVYQAQIDPDYDYQSYQSGIEIQILHQRRHDILCSINRTKVELKLRNR